MSRCQEQGRAGALMQTATAAAAAAAAPTNHTSKQHTHTHTHLIFKLGGFLRGIGWVGGDLQEAQHSPDSMANPRDHFAVGAASDVEGEVGEKGS